MKIRSISLQNVLSHIDSRFELASLTCFRGVNGSGKTTIMESAEVVIAGVCDYTDEGGKGIKQLIRAGEDRAAITLEIEEGAEVYELHNTITQKSGRTPKCTKQSDPTAKCTDYVAGLAINQEVLACLLNGGYFFNKSEKEQRRLLAKIILPRTVEFDPWVWDAIKECGLQVDRTLPAVELIDSIGTTNVGCAYKERTVVNRALKEWREPDKPAEQELTAAQIRERLTERQNQRTEAAVQREKITSAWREWEKDRKRSQVELDGDPSINKSGLREKLTNEGARQSELEKSLLSKTQLKEHEKLAAGESEAAKFAAEISANNEAIRIARKSLTAFNDAFDTCKCPTCTRELPDDVGVEISTRLAMEVARLQNLDNELQKKLAAVGDWQKAKQNIEAHKAAEKSLETVNRRLKDIQKDIKEAERVLESPCSAQPDTTEIDATIASLDARIQTGNGALQEAMRNEQLATGYQAAIESKRKLDAKLMLLEKLLTYFGADADGILAQILSKTVAPFQAKMNDVLKGWGYACQMGFDPYQFDVYVAGAMEQHFIPLATISKSQRASFRVAFQVALAIVTGYKFVWVDEADIWQEDRRRAMYQAVMSAGLDQVVVFQTDTRREIPDRPNSVFYMLTLNESSGLPTCEYERLSHA